MIVTYVDRKHRDTSGWEEGEKGILADRHLRCGPLFFERKKSNATLLLPGTHLGIRDQVPFLHTGVELWVFWNCDKQWTSMVWL